MTDDVVARLEKAQSAIYLACEKEVADDVSLLLGEAGSRIVSLTEARDRWVGRFAEISEPGSMGAFARRDIEIEKNATAAAEITALRARVETMERALEEHIDLYWGDAWKTPEKIDPARPAYRRLQRALAALQPSPPQGATSSPSAPGASHNNGERLPSSDAADAGGETNSSSDGGSVRAAANTLNNSLEQHEAAGVAPGPSEAIRNTALEEAATIADDFAVEYRRGSNVTVYSMQHVANILNVVSHKVRALPSSDKAGEKP